LVPLGSAWLFLTLGFATFFLLLWLVHGQGLRLLFSSTHFFTNGVAVFFFIGKLQDQAGILLLFSSDAEMCLSGNSFLFIFVSNWLLLCLLFSCLSCSATFVHNKSQQHFVFVSTLTSIFVALVKTVHVLAVSQQQMLTTK